MSKLNLYLKAGDYTRTDTLCRTCYLPGVIAITVYVLTDEDMTTAGTVAVCTDCQRAQ